jgi:carbon starvation protein
MGKAKYAPVTIAPLLWLVIINLTAGWRKMFSPDVRVGFLAHARAFSDHLANGTLPPNVQSAADVSRMIFNDRLDAAVAGFFMLCAVVILLASMHEWWLVLSGRKPAKSSEVPYQEYPAMAAD